MITVLYDINYDSIELQVTMFPDKTSQVWKLNERIFESPFVTIRWDFENESEFLHVAQLTDLLKKTVPKVDLFIPYLPYARQDKSIDNKSTFALSTFAKLINTLKFDKIFTIDVHSPVANSLFNNFNSYPAKPYVEFVTTKLNFDLYGYPDAGARKRYLFSDNYVTGNKVRDQSTGYITSFNIEGANPKDKSVLIVDDICDGGMTFILFAKSLYEAGAKEVHLYVSHGIFSKGIKVLKDAGIKRIFTYKGEVYDVNESNPSQSAV